MTHSKMAGKRTFLLWIFERMKQCVQYSLAFFGLPQQHLTAKLLNAPL